MSKVYEGMMEAMEAFIDHEVATREASKSPKESLGLHIVDEKLGVTLSLTGNVKETSDVDLSLLLSKFLNEFCELTA